jgi:Ca2+-binding RTX toxin-like protein
MEGNDTLYGGSGADSLYGGAGIDYLVGAWGNDRLDGGADTDYMAATGDVDFTLTNTKLTGLGTDTLVSIEGVTLTGGALANRIDASQFTAGNVYLFGLGGGDVLLGGSGTDILYGGEGDDVLYGGNGNDLLFGDNGRDTLFGQMGNDRLDGGDDSYVDDLWGGAGIDTFYRYRFWEHLGRYSKTDKVWDLETGETVYNL